MNYGISNGTDLPNVYMVLLEEAAIPCQGAYMWHNGWVTVYISDNQNEGRMFPPNVIKELKFGTPDAD